MSTIKLTILVTETALLEISQNFALLLHNITTEDHKQLQQAVFDSLSDKDGAPQIGDLSVTKFTFDAEKASGQFRIVFNIKRQFCCSDISSCQSDYIDFKFTYQPNILNATGNFVNWNIEN